jgi:hypothetical protein
MNENWKSLKDIVENGDYYEVSDNGNIRSIDRYVKQGNIERIYKGKLISFKTDKYGYLKVSLSLFGKVKSYYAHRLVALAFIPNLDNKPQVNHINIDNLSSDDNKKDNRVTNLEWATSEENIRHAHATGLKSAKKGEESASSKLTDVDIKKIRELWLTGGISQIKLSKMFGVSRGNIQHIIEYKTWKHIS